MENRKLDPRVRFQHAGFTRKLNTARKYKRTNKPRPDSKLQVGLQKIGLASLLTQLLLAAILILVCYLLYVPNPLFVRTVRFEGLSDEYQPLVQEAVKKYFEQTPWYLPSANILFLDKSGLANYMAKEVDAVSRINTSKKSLKTKVVTIDVIQKYERYLVVRPEDQLVLFNDGVIKGKMLALSEPKPQSGAVVTVEINDTTPVTIGQKYFSDSFIELVENSTNILPGNTGQEFYYFEAKLPGDDDNSNIDFSESWKKTAMEAVLKKKPELGKSNPSSVRIIFEPISDIKAVAERLKLLLEQTSPERYRALDYVDMRLPNRAYLCLINTPCINPNP